jgi:hypothetical protein
VAASVAANEADLLEEIDEEQEEDENLEIIGRKRRGIRLKQDLT